MKILRSLKSFSTWRSKLNPKMSVGFVPTMGALHEGHLSLVKKAKRECDVVVVSIFVNPTQFGPNEDFKKYPRTEDKDATLLKTAGADVVFFPSVLDIYPTKNGTMVKPRESLTSMMEGEFRPGHFDGVATVVLKLFEAVKPHRAYFGEKDFQQVRVIEAMVEDLLLTVKIIRCATVREKSGLAMSSRNQYLSPEEKQKASQIYKALRSSKSRESAVKTLKNAGFKVQYLEVWEGRWLIAAYFKGVRLIDNVLRN